MNVAKAALVAAIVAFMAVGFGVSAERASAAKCPKVEVIATVSSNVGSGVTHFTATPASDKLRYNWSVSAGTIMSGQGTPQITVDVPSGDTVMARVTIEGLPKGCQSEAEGEVIAP